MESSSYVHQVSEGASFHLAHDAATMRLDSNLADAEFASDLLVQQAADYKGHDFSLACAE